MSQICFFAKDLRASTVRVEHQTRWGSTKNVRIVEIEYRVDFDLKSYTNIEQLINPSKLSIKKIS